MNISLKPVLLRALLAVVILQVCLFAQDASKVVTTPVGDPAFTVPAHSAKQYKFAVPPGATAVRLDGHFAATGGPRNSIEVWVMNDDEFVNWLNHHPPRAIYNSAKVTQGTLRVSLPSDAGTYHVVFNNEFSVLTPKAVEAGLTLKYAK